jgi:hypothetical protein
VKSAEIAARVFELIKQRNASKVEEGEIYKTLSAIKKRERRAMKRRGREEESNGLYLFLFCFLGRV